MTKISFRDFLLSHEIDIKRFRENCADPKFASSSYTSYEALIQNFNYDSEIISQAFNWAEAKYQPTDTSWNELSEAWGDLLSLLYDNYTPFKVDWNLHLPQIFTKVPNAT